MKLLIVEGQASLCLRQRIGTKFGKAIIVLDVQWYLKFGDCSNINNTRRSNVPDFQTLALSA